MERDLLIYCHLDRVYEDLLKRKSSRGELLIYFHRGRVCEDLLKRKSSRGELLIYFQLKKVCEDLLEVKLSRGKVVNPSGRAKLVSLFEDRSSSQRFVRSEIETGTVLKKLLSR